MSRGTYTNYWHVGLPDAEPGKDPDFAGKHLDDPRVGDIEPAEPEWTPELADSHNDMVAQRDEDRGREE